MNRFLKSTAIALLLVGAALGAAGSADASGYSHGRNHGQASISIDFGTVAFGYQDGYWDNGHRWHSWRQRSDYRSYRDHGSNYYGWNHNRDADHGWQNH